MLISVFFKNKTDGIFVDEKKNPFQTLLKKLPEFELKQVKAEERFKSESLLNSDNKLIVVHFWGTWCAPCEAELPSLLNLIKQLENYPVKFVFVAVKDQLKDIKKYLNKFPLLSESILGLYDNTEEIMDQFGMSKVPETFIFDGKTGKLRKHYVGPQNWNNIYYRQEILNL